MNQFDLTFIEHSTQHSNKNTHLLQVYKKHSPRQIVSYPIKSVPINIKEFKSYKLCSVTNMKLNYKSVSKKIWKILKYLERYFFEVIHGLKKKLSTLN